MKIANHKYHPRLYILVHDDGVFSGAGIGVGFLNRNWDTRIVWYSGTSKKDDKTSIDVIEQWVKELGGNFISSGDSTRNQYWKEWHIPISFPKMLEKHLDSSIVY